MDEVDIEKLRELPRPRQMQFAVKNQPAEEGLYPAVVERIYISKDGDPFLVVKVTGEKI